MAFVTNDAKYENLYLELLEINCVQTFISVFMRGLIRTLKYEISELPDPNTVESR